MPVYEFRCTACGHVMSELRRIGDYASPRCPQCGSTDTEKMFSLFAGGGKDVSCSTCRPAPGG